MIQTGICSISFRKHEPAEIIRWVQEAGLDGIEWGGDVHVPHGDLERAEEVGRMTQEAGLKVSSYGSYYRLGKSAEEGLSFEKVLASALRLEAPVIRIWPGTQDAEHTKPSDREKMVLEAREISTLAAKAGLTVAMEWHKGTLTSTNLSAVDFLREVNHPSFEAFWQPPLYQSPEYCLEGLTQVAGKVRHIHVFNWFPSVGNQAPLAEGESRWSLYFSAFARAAVRGEHFALLEFVHGESREGLMSEGKTLKAWAKQFS